MRLKIFAAVLILVGYSVVIGTQTEWKKFTSSEGRFSVLLPHEPKFEFITDPENKDVANYRYTDLEDGYGFICEYFEISSPVRDVDSFLDVARDGIIRGANATKLKEQKLTVNGYPTRELEISISLGGSDIPATVRVLIAGNRVYTVSYLHSKEMDTKFMSETGTKFFSSFKVETGK